VHHRRRGGLVQGLRLLQAVPHAGAEAAVTSRRAQLGLL
jgi:hypothetical protein